MKLTALTLFLLVLLPIEAFANIRFDVINASDQPLVFEVKGLGRTVLQPGQQNWFSYTHNSIHHLSNFRCQTIVNEVRCGSLPPDQLSAIVYSGRCTINIGRLNNQIICN